MKARVSFNGKRINVYIPKTMVLYDGMRIESVCLSDDGEKLQLVIAPGAFKGTEMGDYIRLEQSSGINGLEGITPFAIVDAEVETAGRRFFVLTETIKWKPAPVAAPTIGLREAVAGVNAHRERMGDCLILEVTADGRLRALVEYV